MIDQITKIEARKNIKEFKNTLYNQLSKDVNRAIRWIKKHKKK